MLTEDWHDSWLLPKALDLSCNVWVNAGWYEGSWVPTLQPGQAHRWGGAAWHAVLTGTPWVTTAHAPALALKFRGEGIFRAVLAVLEDRCLRISSFPTTGRQVSACSANNVGPDPWHYTWPQGLTEQGTSCARGFVHSSQGHEPMFTPRVSTTSMAFLFLFLNLFKPFCILQENFWSGGHLRPNTTYGILQSLLQHMSSCYAAYPSTRKLNVCRNYFCHRIPQN